MRRAVLVAAVAVVAALAPSCSRGGGDDDGFRLVLDGAAEVVGDAAEALDGGEHRVGDGDEVRMRQGTAVLELPGDRSVLLRAGRDDRESTIVTVGERPEVLAGDAVVVAGDDTSFRAGDVEVRVRDGAARVRRGLSVTIGVYEGRAEVRAAGRSFDGGLPALRQLSVPATGVLPREAKPLVYDETDTDPWDLRFIGDAIDLGAELEGLSKGYTGQLGPDARAEPDAIQLALPDLTDVPQVVVADRTPGEALVGSAIALEAGGGDRITSVFSFRDAGARWGLVALDQRVQRDGLIGRLGDAIGRSPLLFAAGPGGGDQGAGGGSDTPGTTTTTTTPPPPGTPPPTTPPDDPEPPAPTQPAPVLSLPGLPPITIPLLPSRDEPEEGSAPASPVSDVLGTLEEIVEGVVDALLPDPGGLL